MATLLYKKTLIIGATSGIGEALAAKLVSQGTKVVVVGRRQDRLNDVVAKLGPDKTSDFAFDITKLKEIPKFAAKIAQEHPDIDSIVVNSGIQRSFDFSRPETINLDVLDEELTTNYTSYIHLTMAFLPLLQSQKFQTHLVYISATLGIVPGMLRTGNYNASKGALHNWILVLREQLKRRPDNNVKTVEVFPPAVQTELHDTRHQPDLKNGGDIGMSLQAFTDELYEGLVEGSEQFGVGMAKATLKGFEKDRVAAFHGMVKTVDGMLQKYLQ
jgi:short-subunit dehydrogenase involved in D-alanine esterification of teichoic acids